jgi:hypothetical protein
MTTFTFLGEFPQVAIALTFAFACAIGMAFMLLWIVLGWVTREQYNVTDAPQAAPGVAVSALAMLRNSSDDYGDRGAGRGPYLLPAASPRNRFIRLPKSIGSLRGRILRFPKRAGSGNEEERNRNPWDGAA